MRSEAHSHHGLPLVRVKPQDLASAGVKRLPRTVGMKDGQPILEDGRVLKVANVLWCTGFRPSFSWFALPVFGELGEPVHERGVVAGEPGLYFVGLDFLFAVSSSMIQGVGRDANHIAKVISARVHVARAAGGRQPKMELTTSV
jgi:putative flavoprotein involved in K+ transport